MADKSFGVKELNLLNASGTPTITSPNNLNLNANNVAISTNVTVGQNITISANAGIASLNVTGISTFTDIQVAEKILHVGDTDTEISFGTDSINLKAGGNTKLGASAAGILIHDTILRPNTDDQVYLGTGTGPQARWKEVHAVTYHGDGSNLTNLPAATPTTSDIQGVYEITNQTSNSYYRFAGNGVDSSANNPDLYLERGKKYRFINNSGGNHPFRIQSDNSSTLYSTGVTNNNASTGNIDFAIRWDAPSHLYYKCGNHGAMLGNIYLTGGVGRWIQQSIVTVQSGTEYELTNIPADVNEVMIHFNGISFNNSGNLKFILGYSGGYTTSGYNISRSYEPGGNYQKGTNGIEFNGTGSAGYYATGKVHLWAPIHGNEWWVEGIAYPDDNEGQYQHRVTGRGNVGGTLSKIKMTSDNNGTFDNTGNGKVQLSYLRY